MKKLRTKLSYALYILLAVCTFSCKELADKLPESNRGYVMQPNCAVGQVWIKYDTLDPFTPEIDTLEILKIKKGWAWIKYNNKNEFSKECDAIERFWQYYR